MTARNGWLIVTIALLSACAREEQAQPRPAPGEDPVATEVAPAIVAPLEAADPAAPPSYEVSIASVAANRNQELERCAKQPEAVRTQCQQEANAAFAEATATLKPLRGNQE
jgi:hypothetical protein